MTSSTSPVRPASARRAARSSITRTLGVHALVLGLGTMGLACTSALGTYTIDNSLGTDGGTAKDGGSAQGDGGSGGGASDSGLKSCSSSTYHYVFATAETYPGNLGGVKAANTTCTSLALAAGFTGTWVAWLAAGNGGGGGQGPTGYVTGPLYSRDCTPVVTNLQEFQNNLTIAHAINEDQHGVQLSAGSFAWTGTLADGTASQDTCNSWSDGTQNSKGTVGSVSSMNNQWSEIKTSQCNTLAHLYCIQQSL